MAAFNRTGNLEGSRNHRPIYKELEFLSQAIYLNSSGSGRMCPLYDTNSTLANTLHLDRRSIISISAATTGEGTTLPRHDLEISANSVRKREQLDRGSR